MDKSTLENQWNEYAGNRSSSKIARGFTLGGVVATTGAAVFSLQSQADASYVKGTADATIYFNTNGGDGHSAPGANVLLFNIPGQGSGGVQFRGYGGANYGGYGGIEAVKGSFKLNGNTGASRGLKQFGHFATIANTGFAKATGANFKTTGGVTVTGEGLPLGVKKASGALVAGTIGSGADIYVGIKQSGGVNNGDIGWIELIIGNDGGGANANLPDYLTIEGYAYNATPGGPITINPVPEASNTATALLLLACAGGSLVSWRRKQQATAVATTATA